MLWVWPQKGKKRKKKRKKERKLVGTWLSSGQGTISHLLFLGGLSFMFMEDDVYTY